MDSWWLLGENTIVIGRSGDAGGSGGRGIWFVASLRPRRPQGSAGNATFSRRVVMGSNHCTGRATDFISFLLLMMLRLFLFLA